MKSKLSAVFIGLTLSLPLAAQSTEDWGMWFSNTFRTDFGGSSYLTSLELGPRLKSDNSQFSQFYLRPMLGYKLTKQLQLWLGYSWQGEYSNKNQFDLATQDVIEQLQWSDSLSPQVNVQYRFRLEQRLFAGEEDGHRMRHRLRLQYSIPDSKIYLVVLDELFVYFNSINTGRLAHSVQVGINQNRDYLGIGYKLTENINMDTGYQLQYVHYYGKPDLLNHIWQTNISVNF